MLVTWGNNQQLLLLSSPFPGPELVTNGDFAAGGTGWTVFTTGGLSSITGGQMVFNDPADDGDTVSQPVPYTAGQGLRVTFTVTARTSGSIRFRLTAGTAVLGTIRNAPGTYVEDVIALTSGTGLEFFGSAPILNIDNISVKRIS